VRVTPAHDVGAVDLLSAIFYLLFANELKASSRALLLAVDGVVEDSQVFLNNVRR
jgi:hypothetical protein